MRKLGIAKRNKITEHYSYIDVKSSVHAIPKLTIKGTRITVEDILEDMAGGMSPDEISEQYRIPKKAVTEAIRFAYGMMKRVTILASG